MTIAPSIELTPNITQFPTKTSKAGNYAVIALFSALAVATSLILVFVPNLETITLVIFIISLRYGFRMGLFTAVTITLTFEIMASQIYGSGAVVIPFKLLAYLLVGLTGHIWGESNQVPGKTILAVTGASLAIIYDLITTFGIVFWLNQPMSTYFVLVAIGFVAPPFFTPLHMIGNAFLFQLIPSIQNQLENITSHHISNPEEGTEIEKRVG